MNIDTFNALSQDEKADVIFDAGQQLDERAIYNQLYIRLYKLHDFYVEVFYNIKTKRLQRIKTTTEEDVLENYIDLREVYLTNRNLQPPKR